MSVLLTIGDILAVVAICLALLSAIVLMLYFLISVGIAIYDGWKGGADNE